MLNSPRTIFRRQPKNDCYGCESRKVGCHSTCEKYATFQKENLEDYTNIRRAYMGERKAERYTVDQKKEIARRKSRLKKYF